MKKLLVALALVLLPTAAVAQTPLVRATVVDAISTLKVNGVTLSDASRNLTATSLATTSSITIDNNAGLNSKQSGGSAVTMLYTDSSNRTRIDASGLGLYAGSGTNQITTTAGLLRAAALTGTVSAVNGGTGIDTSGAVNGTPQLNSGVWTIVATVPAARLGSGSPSSSTFLRGDSSWQVVDVTNASNLTTGTLPTGRLSGSYTGITGVGTIATGTWNGTIIQGASYVTAMFGALSGSYTCDTPYTASTDMMVHVSTGSSGAASVTTEGVTFFAGGNGVGGGRDMSVKKGQSFTVNLNGGTCGADVIIYARASGG